ncbi:MAG: hypothetical protein A3B91_01985 [Candidatus Yanofskybacteria bacterium RIFCSPHIGHO2_02_FULL_41_29]|uniref:Uncharacterized protein n=1 Tax=Candidatus Yanofskybacteria bacterium RIFCSPHIGHO2_01_FULL_41_53 TaxID=1802663 RepID=A0A1F8EGR1_9BACT|nr:MAG: hypothetical protein A2650_04195 [Candidatus Yanofskybacteria bacterium RIFCSPHIGHO2_01_FULL_41_53]OGN11230.1 MAG: hypothetical protein A3B91_01985 [Candidatus Yanofskybacteria bacterium RIFCSPHIGHO2_02_FULL_41_29]OGN23550.1 MAG: hypothetical protein A2916_01420 [Candidatus Yanofskybacteria bacterium RIFCSPLOWO2_01_FULL_41_67]OGN28392.1 MAG: hypothetical protein A3H54_02750 [Candidatus Yanofskybacteria bacterium RIFCSPLOWO2_02_FULL_41_13]
MESTSLIQPAKFKSLVSKYKEDQERIPNSDLNISRDTEPLFLNPKESIDRIDSITLKLGEITKKQRSSKFLASVVYCLALRAQSKILNYLNDENFFCRVLWDQRTNLPSHPSLAADVGKYGETFDPSPELKSVLSSLSGWALFRQEKLLCCCGRKEKIRTVDLDLLLNTVIKVEERGLSVKLLVGVKANDVDHLEVHYNIKRQSQVDSGLQIIFTCENLIRLDGEEVTAEPVSFSHAEQFNVPELDDQIFGLDTRSNV